MTSSSRSFALSAVLLLVLSGCGPKDGVKEYEAAIGKDDILKQVDALQRRADDLQDALDEFNASTKVEIEVDG